MHSSYKLDGADQGEWRTWIKVVSDGVHKVAGVYLDVDEDVQHADVWCHVDRDWETRKIDKKLGQPICINQQGCSQPNLSGGK